MAGWNWSVLLWPGYWPLSKFFTEHNEIDLDTEDHLPKGVDFLPANNSTGDSLSVHKKGFQCDFDEDVDRFAAAATVGVLRYIVEDVVDTRLHFILFYALFSPRFFSKSFILYYHSTFINILIQPARFVFSITFHFIKSQNKKKDQLPHRLEI